MNTVSGLISSYPGEGGADRITLSSGMNWVIAGSGMDEVNAPSGGFIAMEIGRFSFLDSADPGYFEWRILSSPESSTGGSLFTVDGYLVEETPRTLPFKSGSNLEI